MTVVLVDGEQRQIPFTLGDLSDPTCPGYEHCCGVVATMFKGANTAVKLHNCNLENSLPMTVHASVIDFLTSSDNVLHDKVAKELEALIRKIHSLYSSFFIVTLVVQWSSKLLFFHNFVIHQNIVFDQNL